MLVVGDVMLDCFLTGSVARISPEAPVPVLKLERESYMPGGAANVARNLTALGAPTLLCAPVGKDRESVRLRRLLKTERVDCRGLFSIADRTTSVKTRVVTKQQQIVRIDQERVQDLDIQGEQTLLEKIRESLARVKGVVVGDYGKGTITDSLLTALKTECRKRQLWLGMDPKPIHRLDLSGLSLLTPNRKEVFELAGLDDRTRNDNPLADDQLCKAVKRLRRRLDPDVLLVTLGELGMLLSQRGKSAVHVPTGSREVFDVSGAGDTAIASFMLAVSTGTNPLEAAVFANRAAGIVIKKRGTSIVTEKEMLDSFLHSR